MRTTKTTKTSKRQPEPEVLRELPETRLARRFEVRRPDGKTVVVTVPKR